MPQKNLLRIRGQASPDNKGVTTLALPPFAQHCNMLLQMERTCVRVWLSLADFPMAMQGAGVIPILAIYDLQNGDDGDGKIFFYDVLGAQFEVSDFATSGSGSVWIRGVLYHLNRWGKIPLANMTENQAITNIMKLLETASEYDAATGGYNSRSAIFPTIKTITRRGIADLQTEKLRQVYEKSVEVKLA